MDADAPFVAAPVGDAVAAAALAARLADRMNWPPPMLLRVGMNASYRSGDVAIRVGRPTTDPSAAYLLATALREAGVRVPAPAAGAPVELGGDGLAATAWEYAATSGPAAWAEVGRMLARLHRLDPGTVAAGYPTPQAPSLPWWNFDELLRRARPMIDETAFDGLAATVARHGDWALRAGSTTDWVLCHGDIHQHNVVFTAQGPVLLDWDLLCIAPPVWDHAPLRAMVAHWGVDPSWLAEFERGYGVDPAARGDGVVESLTQLRSVAATLLRVAAEGAHRAADSEAERRLRFWRGEPSPPVWRFV